MSDYNNRIKEWITNLVIEELNEDDSWWTSMSADQQADYIKRHPQSQKAQDAKKEKEDEPSHEEIMQHIEDEGYGGDAIGPDGNPTPEAYEDAKQELMYQKQQDAKKEKGDDGGKDDPKPTSDEVDDIKQASDIAKFMEKHENNLSDDEQKYLRQLAQSVLFGGTPPRRAQRYIKQKLGLDKPSPAIQPKTQSKPKQKVAGAADSREVRNNVMNRLGRDQFNKLSYGELQQAYDDEFEKLGWKKKGKDYVKQESIVKSTLKLEEVVGKSLTEEQFDEAAGKKDACYHKVKARYDVWPSAYASGALVKCRKVGAKNWGNKSKKEGTLKEFGLSPTDRVLKSTMKNPKTGKTVTVGSIMNQGTKKYPPALVKKARAMFKMAMDKETQIRKKLYGKKEGVNENIGKLIGVAVGIAKKMSGNMTGAVKKIEKISKGLSKLEPVQKALRKYNEGYPGKSLKPLHDDELDNEGFASDAQRRAAFASGYEEKGKKKKKKESVEEAYDIWMEDGSWGYTMTGIVEAEYQGRKVKLGKPMQGDVKKFKVYVKNPKGNVVKVNFGQGGDAKGGTMRIRKSNPKARANFRARHNCDNPGPRHKARYWSCRKW